jgi:hypothetical protein
MDLVHDLEDDFDTEFILEEELIEEDLIDALQTAGAEPSSEDELDPIPSKKIRNKKKTKPKKPIKRASKRRRTGDEDQEGPYEDYSSGEDEEDEEQEEDDAVDNDWDDSADNWDTSNNDEDDVADDSTRMTAIEVIKQNRDEKARARMEKMRKHSRALNQMRCGVTKAAPVVSKKTPVEAVNPQEAVVEPTTPEHYVIVPLNAYPTSIIGYEDYEKEVKERIALGQSRLRTGFVPCASVSCPDFYSTPTTLCCMHCTEPIDGYPIPRLIKRGGEKQQYVEGMYCTYGCVIAATIEHNGSVLNQRRMLRELYGRGQEVQCDIGGHSADRRLLDAFVPAPPRNALAKFGGHMTIEEFRGCSLRGVRVREVRVPFMPIVPGFEEEFISRWSVYNMGLFRDRVFNVEHMAAINDEKMQRTKDRNRGTTTKRKPAAPKRRSEDAIQVGMYSEATCVEDQIRIAKAEAQKTEERLFGTAALSPPSSSSVPTSPIRTSGTGFIAMNETPIVSSPVGASPSKKRNLFDYMKRS